MRGRRVLGYAEGKSGRRVEEGWVLARVVSGRTNPFPFLLESPTHVPLPQHAADLPEWAQFDKGKRSALAGLGRAAKGKLVVETELAVKRDASSVIERDYGCCGTRHDHERIS